MPQLCRYPDDWDDYWDEEWDTWINSLDGIDWYDDDIGQFLDDIWEEMRQDNHPPNWNTDIPDDVQGVYVMPDGSVIGQLGTDDRVRVITSTVPESTLQVFYTNAAGGSSWSQNYLRDNSDILTFNDGTELDIDQYEDIANTVYTEMGFVATSTVEEAAAIYSTVENRAQERGHNEWDEFQHLDSNGIPEIRGWQQRNRTDNTDPFSMQKLRRAYQGVHQAMTNNTDYSDGAYFWHGTDLNDPNSGAYAEYYNNGLDIPDPTHNLYGLADNPQGNTGSTGQTWDYKYQVTNAEHQTTFMRLHPTWQQAENHPGNL